MMYGYTKGCDYMDTLKSGRTPYVYYTSVYSSERTIYANLLGTF